MASVVTPLQLTVTSAMLQNTGLNSVPTALATAIANFNATTLITNYLTAVNAYKAQSYFTESTFDSLLSIGSTVCPALGNSIPAAPVGTYTNLVNEYLTPNTVTDASTLDPSGFSLLIEQTAAAYLGDGDYGKFSQGFMAVQNYIDTLNRFIYSAVNANEYLGPTFTDLDDMITADITKVNSNLQNFGQDLVNQGQLFNFNNLDLYGTPAGLLQQIAAVTGISTQAPPGVHEALKVAGLTDDEIRILIVNNRYSLTNPGGVSDNEFNRLQQLAYNGFLLVDPTTVQQVLSVLQVTTPNIVTLEQLLEPRAVFPLSYTTMTVPTFNGPVSIFQNNGAVNMAVAPAVNSALATPTGCDELGKVIPPADAVANKAIEVGLKQIAKLVPNVDLPDLANAILGTDGQPWNSNTEWLTNSVVRDTAAIPNYYRAAQDVPVGTDINNTAYWTPTDPGGLNKLTGLPLLTAQTTPVASSVTSYFAVNVATGTGPNNSITTTDVLGTAIDFNDFATRLNTATAQVNSLQGAGSLAALNTAYTNIAAAGSDAAVQTQIANANAAIAALSANPAVPILNTAWTYIANYLNRERGYQIAAGVDYFNLQANEKSSIYSFVQLLPQYAEKTAANDAAEFLADIANTSTLGGQAIVGAMREARNQARLNAAGIATYNQIPIDPPLLPIPAVLPVNT
jgi:hypothetical protein